MSKSSTETWITADLQEIPIDDMSEPHVRNALKLIMRKAREDRVWAISPMNGGLRHYEKGDPHVATVKARPAAPAKPANPWDEVDKVHLELNREEAQVLLALVTETAVTPVTAAIYDAFNFDLARHNPIVARARYGAIELIRQ